MRRSHRTTDGGLISLPLSLIIICTQSWGNELFSALKAAGGTAYSNYAVGYNNVDVPAATRNGIPVGNTPGEALQPYP